MIITTMPPAIAPSHHLTSRSLRLPVWAFDGRPLQWNATGSACIVECSAAEYHSDKLALSSTMLKALARSPRHMLEARATSGKETRSRRLGTAVHARVLEAGRYARDYVAYKGKRAGKKWEKFKEQNAGRSILTEAEWELVEAVAAKVRCEPVLAQGDEVFTMGDLVDLGECEQTLYWIDDETGVTCKARYDLTVGKLTVDLKTTDDAREDGFAKQADKLGYDIQAAFYLRGRKAFDPSMDVTPFVFVAAELMEHGDVLCHVAHPDEFIAYGEEAVRRSIRKYAGLVNKRAADYPGYEKRGGILRLPVYRRFPGVELH